MSILTSPDLEDRFLPPSNWRTDSFTRNNREIYYRTAFVKAPKAIVFILPGLSEYGEKYIETTQFLNTQNFNVVIIDWAYQGLSSRDNTNPHKRQSDGVEEDIADLQQLITREISSPLPHLMLAHSMGANYGLRYLDQHPTQFNAVSLSAPMLGIAGICRCHKLTKLLLKILSPFKNSYVPGGHDWSEKDRKDIVKGTFSHDKIRREIHSAWMVKNSKLQIGNPTYRWLEHNLRSIYCLAQRDLLENIKQPIFLGLAEKDSVVDNNAIIHAAKHLPNAHIEYLNESAHEILMEIDAIHDVFLDKTINLFNQSI